MNARRKAPNKRNDSSDFVEALARGLDVIKAFGPTAMELTVSEVAARTGLARPTARRLLMTLEQLGYTRLANGAYTLTTKTLELGTAYVAAQGLWDIARPHLASLVAKTGESSSMSQLDGSDIVYTARVPVPKIIALSVQIGTRFPAAATSMGRVLLADLDKSELDKVLATPSASGVIPRVVLSRSELDRSLGRDPRARLGAVGRVAVARDPFDRGTGAGPLGTNGSGDERHRARRRDVDRATRRRVPPPPPADRRRRVVGVVGSGHAAGRDPRLTVAHR